MFKRGSGRSASGPIPSAKHPNRMSSVVVIKKDPSRSADDVNTKSGDGQSEEPPHISASQFAPSKSVSQKDLMISYSHADNEFMLKIRDELEKNGISVWVDVSGLQAGVDFLSKIGEAIIDCKLFLPLLSVTSVKSKYCQDELALAYVSSRIIFPVTLDTTGDLYSAMDTGMKLQLARYEWTELGRDANKFDEKIVQLITLMKQELHQQNDEAKADSKPKGGRARFHRQKTQLNLMRKIRLEESSSEFEAEPEKYWKDHFGAKDEIPWANFVEVFKKDFASQLSSLFNEENTAWLISVLHREMEVEEEALLFKHAFLAFCNIEGEYYPLWDRVDEQARESWSMKEVFDMNSSVRVEAIENLGKFHSAAVIDALRDLLQDEDANIRAVAAVSLARTEVNDPVTCKYLMKTLNDKDRLVREAGCLALGHLKVKQAISKLLHLWRNDVISHVREAANVALSQIGGAEVEKQMKVTKVLADEIRQLTLS